MLIYGDQMKDSYCYNTSIVLDVVAIIIGNIYNLNSSNRDILLKLHDRDLQRISKLHLSYNSLYYILLFLKDDNG